MYQLVVNPFVPHFNSWVNPATYVSFPVHPVYTLQRYCLKNYHPLRVLFSIPNSFKFYSKNSNKSISNPTRQNVIALGGYNNQFSDSFATYYLLQFHHPDVFQDFGVPNTDSHLRCYHRRLGGSCQGGRPHFPGKSHHSRLRGRPAEVSPENQEIILRVTQEL